MLEQDFIVVQGEIGFSPKSLDVRTTRSGGPGGQHVNKTETKVWLTFSLHDLQGLTTKIRLRLISNLQDVLEGGHILRIVSQRTRSQHRNKIDALEKLVTILREGLQEKTERKPTRVPQSVMRRRLEYKKKQGDRKKQRAWRWQG
ncbi:MAG: alternative ribosome rescue aminoacyl-tRNA hydrolase ArfB [Myxococcota bacterium]